MSMITATSWVPRGFPAQFPTRADFNEEEFARIQELANLQLQDAKDDLREAQAKGSKSGSTDAETATKGSGKSLDRTNA